MKKAFTLIAALVVVLFIALIVARSQRSILVGSYKHTLNISNQTLFVDIATTPTQMQQGLSGRTAMAENQGMLFDFGQNASDTPRFWMKDMHFGLDFIWIQNNKVVGITKNVPAPPLGTPEQNLQVYTPPSPVNEVLEVNAGWFDRHHTQTGDAVN